MADPEPVSTTRAIQPAELGRSLLIAKLLEVIAIGLALLALAFVLQILAGCSGLRAPTPREQGAVAEATCTLLQAFAASPAEQAICATADELIGMESDVRNARADAGPGKLGRKSGQCRIIPNTTVCATEEELAMAIAARKAAR